MNYSNHIHNNNDNSNIITCLYNCGGTCLYMHDNNIIACLCIIITIISIIDSIIIKMLVLLCIIISILVLLLVLSSLVVLLTL